MKQQELQAEANDVVSPPAWGRGLKLSSNYATSWPGQVAPRVGAWIETCCQERSASFFFVAPRVGAWIETMYTDHPSGLSPVAPRVGAWIETQDPALAPDLDRVAPRVGAWIETDLKALMKRVVERRPPRGGVD